MTQTQTTTITDIISSTSNDMFRKGTPADKSYIHDSQIDAAKEIVSSFHNMVTRRNHVMLIAKMQSGKTGVCNAVVNIINKLDLARQMGVDKFFFITGMNDCGLKSQTHERLFEQVDDANVGNTYTGKRSNKRTNGNNKYFVLKNSDLRSLDEDINNSVIFIDECHYGSNEKNVLTQFLYSKGIDWKNQNFLISRNIYIVSVSATPFSELISDTADAKKCVELKTHDGYVGVSEYVENGLVHNGKFDDTVGEVTYALADALDQMEKDGVAGVCIVRTRKFDEIEQDLFVQHNFDIHEMYSSGKKIEYDRLTQRINELIADNEYNKQFDGVTMKCLLNQKKQIKPLLVLIKGAFRAGVTIEANQKDYIYMVYDYSQKSAATAQAMLGRMCGYRADDTKIKTHFYINDTMANMYAKWESDFSDRTNIPCDKMKQEWVEESEFTGNETLSSKSCGNFAIDLDDAEIEMLFSKCRSKKTGRANAKLLFPKILENHGIAIPYDYFHEAHMKGKNNYAASSQMKRFESFSDDSLVFGFRADKMVDFINATGRDYLTDEDFGKKCVSIVLDAEIDADKGKVIGGNKRLLVYYVEVGAFRIVPNQMSMFQKHKNTSDI